MANLKKNLSIEDLDQCYQKKLLGVPIAPMARAFNLSAPTLKSKLANKLTQTQLENINTTTDLRQACYDYQVPITVAQRQLNELLGV